MSLIENVTSTEAAGHEATTQRLPRDVVATQTLIRPWRLRTSVLAFGSVPLVALLAIGVWLATGSVVPWDSKNHFYPMFRFLAEALARGEIPLWNPYHFAGHPSVADPQSLLFTPSMVLFALLVPQASMQAFDVAIFAHLVAGGLGVVGVSRRARWHPAAAVLAAIIYMLGGAASSRLQHTGMIISYGFFPLALWLLDVALERCSLVGATAFGATAALMALGRDQVAFMLCATLLGRLAWHLARSGDAPAYLLRRLPTLAVAAATVVAIVALPVLLTLQFLGASNRPGIAYGVAAAGSLAPVNLITMVVPNIFGSLSWHYDYWGPGYETMTEADWTDRAVNYLFVGSAPALLLVWHGLAGGRLFAREVRFFSITALLAILYALGRYTPAFALAFDWLPAVSFYRRPADATFLFNIALAFSAGYLLHVYVVDGLPKPLRDLPRPLAFGLPGAVVAGVALLVGSALAFSRAQQHLQASLGSLAGAAAGVGGLVAVLVLLRRPDRRALAAMLIVAATTGELVWRDAASSLNAEPIGGYPVFSELPPSQAAGLAVLERELASRHQDGDTPRVEILGLGGAWQNASMVLKIENTLGYNPLRIADYERAVGPGENAVDPNLRHFPGTFRGYRCSLAMLLGLEYLVLDRPLAQLPRHVPRPAHATLLYAGDHMFVYKLGAAAPRVYVASRIRPVDADAVLDDHAMPDFAVGHEALIDTGSLPDLENEKALEGPLDLAKLDSDQTFGAAGHARITAYGDNAVRIDVDTPVAGVLVLHDIFYPGWEVAVDGASKPLLRANILFRGVEVPAGHHTVTFDYRPLSIANLRGVGDSLLHRGEN